MMLNYRKITTWFSCPISDELLAEKERYKSISDELDSTFAELAGYWAHYMPVSTTLDKELPHLTHILQFIEIVHLLGSILCQTIKIFWQNLLNLQCFFSKLLDSVIVMYDFNYLGNNKDCIEFMWQDFWTCNLFHLMKSISLEGKRSHKLVLLVPFICVQRYQQPYNSSVRVKPCWC